MSEDEHDCYTCKYGNEPAEYPVCRKCITAPMDDGAFSEYKPEENTHD